jgi:hypothetical protein
MWLAVVALAAAVSATPFARLQEAALPSGVTPYIWSWPAPWPVLFPAAGAVAVTLVHRALMLCARSRAHFPAVWLASVGAGAAVGLTVDVSVVFANVLADGWAIWALDLGSRAAVGAYWGLLFGWVPSLVARRLTHRTATDAPPNVPRPAASVVLVTLALASLLALGLTQILGNDATQAQLRAEQAAAEPYPLDGAAPPDPRAEGDPVPERAQGAGVADSDGCTPERAMVLIGDVDGATGHRGLRLELMNFSDAPCTVEGYPDIAFGDQNQHLLDVTVGLGGSFMATDPGPAPVTIPPGHSAVAYIGWDANSTQGARVARTVWVATLAGEVRGSKPIDSDVVAGSNVTVTAWALPVTDAVSD